MKNPLSQIFKILNPAECKTFAWLTVLNVLISLLDIAFLGLLLFVVNFYTKNTGVPVAAFLPQKLFNQNSLVLVCLFFVLFGLKNLLAFIVSKKQYSFIYGAASRISKSNLLAYLKGNYAGYAGTDSSVHIRKISQQPIELGHYILLGIQQIIAQVVLIFFTLSAIVVYKPFVFMLLFALLVPPVAFIGYLIKRGLKNVRLGTKTAHEKNIQYLNEALAGYVESNLYQKDNFFINRYYVYQQQQNKHIANQQILQGLPSRLIEVFAILGFVILIIINKWSAHSTTLDFMTIGAFIAASYKIIPGIVTILNCSGQIKTYTFTLDDLAETAAWNTTENSAPIKRINSVSFKNVSFHYKNRDVLNDFNLDLKPGDMAGLSADSGRGKTTIINLLLGFLTPDAGSILFNYAETQPADCKRHWGRISYIKQQSFFVHDTVLNNITLDTGETDACRLSEALAISGFDKEIQNYAGGLNHVINENGKNLSGGQRQRLLIARALYHDFDLLILDEPFSEMDEDAERSILKHLGLLAKTGKIILLITHHKASLAYCNQVITLNQQYAEA